MVFIFFGITIIYLLLIIGLIIGFNRVPSFTTSSSKPTTRFSILIPFRNEASVLNTLLTSLNALNYPKNLFELILIDDNSTDYSIDIITDYVTQHKDLNLIILPNKRISNSPKKDAIHTAILHAKNNWLITTDADCQFPKTWLQTIDAFISNTASKMIVAPVTYISKSSFLTNFQVLDFLSLQTATIGGFGLQKPFLCNGANLIYEKALFNSLNGFKGNSNIASGDDIFLLEKASKQYPNDIHYLKSLSVLVKTLPQPNFKTLIYQRMRWAAKASAYNSAFGKGVGFIIFLMNALIIIILCLSIVNVFEWSIFGMIFGLKFIADFFFIQKSATLFQQTSYLKTYFINALLYPIFSVLVVILTVFIDYKWKGRHFKK